MLYVDLICITVCQEEEQRHWSQIFCRGRFSKHEFAFRDDITTKHRHIYVYECLNGIHIL
jgi:hypothetical protein